MSCISGSASGRGSVVALGVIGDFVWCGVVLGGVVGAGIEVLAWLGSSFMNFFRRIGFGADGVKASCRKLLRCGWREVQASTDFEVWNPGKARVERK